MSKRRAAPLSTDPARTSRWFTVGCVVAVLLASVLAIAFAWSRITQVDFVTAQDQDPPRSDAASSTGWAGGTRALIVPAHAFEGYDWTMQTQRMLQLHEWRLSQVDYDNAPEGRAVHGAAIFRWYLGGLAWVNHALGGKPLGRCAERATVWAGPVLQLGLLVGGLALLVGRAGAFAAALFALGVAGVFPFAAGFIPGIPDPVVAGQAAGVMSLLLLLAGHLALPAKSENSAEGKRLPRVTPWFVAAGFVGALGLWLDPLGGLVLQAGVSVGGLVAGWMGRRQADALLRNTMVRAWSGWGIAGVMGALAARLIDAASAGGQGMISSSLLGAIAWFGAAILLQQFWRFSDVASPRARFVGAAILGVGLLAVLVVPSALMLEDSWVLLPRGRAALALTRLPNAVVATDFRGWLGEQEGSGQLLACLLPVITALGVAGWSAWRGRHQARCGFLWIALGALLAALPLAWHFLQRWQQVDAAAIALLAGVAAVVASQAGGIWRGWIGLGLLVVLLLPSLRELRPPRGEARQQVPVSEVNALLERDLARWLARRTGGSADVIVWAPPATTTALTFYGGFRGLGSVAEENVEGLTAAFRIARASSAPEALAQLQRRHVTHLILPTWDTYFDELIPAGADHTTGTFLEILRRGEFPAWLRPVAYQFRKPAGLEAYGVMVLEIVDEQEEVLAVSRRAEFFAEMGLLNAAVAEAETLKRFATDLGALAARAQVEAARGDSAALTQIGRTMQTRLAAGADRFLAWDRRVSLALVLARQNEVERARDQTKRCLKELTPERVRTLSPGMLFNLQLLAAAFETEINDPVLRALARDLLPIELRSRLP